MNKNKLYNYLNNINHNSILTFISLNYYHIVSNRFTLLKYFLFFIILFLQWDLTAQYVDKFNIDSLVIQFENASSDIKPTDYPLLYRLADTLNQNPSIQVLIRGHVCCVKRNGLAKARAKTVRKYLINFGVDPKRLTSKGMKNSMPIIFPEKSHQDELINMRVDFVYTII